MANINRKVMEQFDLEQINKLVEECEEIRNEMFEIAHQQKAQNEMFEQELICKQKELEKVLQMIANSKMSTLETSLPKYFKLNEPYRKEPVIEVYKTKNIIFVKNKHKIFADKLSFKHDDGATLCSNRISIDLGHSLSDVYYYLKNYFQELTKEEYNECKKKIFEMASNIM